MQIVARANVVRARVISVCVGDVHAVINSPDPCIYFADSGLCCGAYPLIAKAFRPMFSSIMNMVGMYVCMFYGGSE